jgi:hypothetical protein
MGVPIVTVVDFDHNHLLIALYKERVWCALIWACLLVIFGWGSFSQRRLTGIIGVLVFGSLEVYSVFVEYPSFHWILVGYAGFCLGLGLRVLAERYHPHHPDAVHTA